MHRGIRPAGQIPSDGSVPSEPFVINSGERENVKPLTRQIVLITILNESKVSEVDIKIGNTRRMHRV